MGLLGALRLGFNALFIPQTCVLCDRWVLNARSIPLCDPCRDSLFDPAGPGCCVCGRSLPGSLLEGRSICSRCRERPGTALLLRCCGSYDGDLREVLHRYKFGSRRRLSWPLGELLRLGLERGFSDVRFDWLVAVPSHPSRVRERGFDAVGLLARRLSDQSDIPVFPGIRRTRLTRPQSGLSRERRARNVRGAFDASMVGGTLGGNILILDDIVTTGATLLSLADAIESHCRAESLGALAVARTGLWQ